MPFIVRYPESIEKGSECDLLINNTDFAPTMIDFGGGKAPDAMQGKSFARTLNGKEQLEWREATYYRYWMHMAHKLGNPAHFGIRTKRYKLIFFYGADFEDPPRMNYWGSQADVVTPPGWELYDLEKDPSEMNNLYPKPEYDGLVEELKDKLKSVREELDETDRDYPHIQKIIDKHWGD